MLLSLHANVMLYTMCMIIYSMWKERQSNLTRRDMAAAMAAIEEPHGSCVNIAPLYARGAKSAARQGHSLLEVAT